MATQSRHRIAIIAMALAVLIAGTLIIRGSQDEAEDGSAAAQTSAPTDSDPDRSLPDKRPRRVTQTFAGEITGGAIGWFNSEMIYPQTNAWTISNLRYMTAVEAGAVAGNPRDGLLGIHREGMAAARFPGNRKSNLVTVPGTGAVRIVKAPLGRGAIQTWAQHRGEIRFTSESGTTGTLRLRDDSIVLDAG